MSTTTPPGPGAERRVAIDAIPMLEMPIELFREAIRGFFVPGTKTAPGTTSATDMSKILVTLAGALMYGKTTPDGPRKMGGVLPRAQAARRAAEFLEIAEWLDGLGPRGPEGDA